MILLSQSPSLNPSQTHSLVFPWTIFLVPFPLVFSSFPPVSPLLFLSSFLHSFDIFCNDDRNTLFLKKFFHINNGFQYRPDKQFAHVLAYYVVLIVNAFHTMIHFVYTYNKYHNNTEAWFSYTLCRFFYTNCFLIAVNRRLGSVISVRSLDFILNGLALLAIGQTIYPVVWPDISVSGANYVLYSFSKCFYHTKNT